MSEAGDRMKAALSEALEWVRTLSDEDRERLMRAQQASYARSITDWPKSNFEWINGVKVYSTYEDYCND